MGAQEAGEGAWTEALAGAICTRAQEAREPALAAASLAAAGLGPTRIWTDAVAVAVARRHLEALEAAREAQEEQAADSPSPAFKLAPLPAPGDLAGARTKRQAVLGLCPRQPGGVEAVPQWDPPKALPAAGAASTGQGLLFLGPAARAAVTGLTEEAAHELCRALAAEGGGTEDGAGECQVEMDSWGTWRSGRLRIAVVEEGRDGRSPEEQLAMAAHTSPHVVVVHVGLLQTHGALCAVLRNFKGALLVLEGDRGDLDEDEAGGILRTLGVTTRWRVAGVGFEPAKLPLLQPGKVFGDLKVSDLARDPMLLGLLKEAEPLYQRHFHEDLTDEVGSWQDAYIAFLVQPGKTTADKQLLGFVVYKFWDWPLRCMSVLRIAVPDKYRMLGCGRQLMRWAMDKARRKPRRECTKVTLCAVPEAVTFYERLNFVRTEEATDAPMDVEDEDIPQPLPGAVWMSYRLIGNAPK